MSSVARGWVPVGFWILLWAGLNAAPEHLAGQEGLVPFLHATRFLLPGVMGIAALILLARGGVWPLGSALSCMAAAGLVGIVSSMIISPAPWPTAAWGLSYLAVPLVVGLALRDGRAPDSVQRLLTVNWFAVAAVGTAAAVLSLCVMLAHDIRSFWEVYGRHPAVGGLPMILPTGLARYWAVIGLLALVGVLTARRVRPRIAWSGIIVLALVVLFLCESRTAAAAFLIATAVTLLLAGHLRVVLGLVAGAGVATVVWWSQLWPYAARFLQADKVGGVLSGRLGIWQSAVALWQDSPVLGFGFHADRLLLQGPYTTHTSNAFLQMLVQSGLFGGVLFVAGWAFAWRALYRATRRTQGWAARARGQLLLCVGVTTFLFVRSFFESTGAFFGVDWLLLAPLLAASERLGEAPSGRSGGSAGVPARDASNGLPAMSVLGVRVHPIPLEDVLQRMERWIRAGDRGRYIVASGMHVVMEARRHPGVRTAVNGADLFVPDGYSLVWLARRRGIRVERRVCGTDLLWAFCRLAYERQYRMFFYGDTPEVLGRLRSRIAQAYPGALIVGCESPPFRPLTPAEDAAIIQRINAATPDVVWVGLGAPKQERWMAEHRVRVRAPVLVGVGAAFRFLSGDVRRAPGWVGEHGLEWVWRLMHEPRKLWRRAVLDVPRFTALALLELAGLLEVPEAPATVQGEVATPVYGRRLRRGPQRQELWRQVVARLNAGAKRTFDVVVASVGLIVSSPLWLVIAWRVKRGDDGPVFYVQERVGRQGRRFQNLKFRTMIPNADEGVGVRQATEDDQRVTRVGQWLRATALDELPQLFNILRGDMSFVGPRALAEREIEVNGHGMAIGLDEIPGYEARQQVRPGLTGLAQVYARRDLPRRQKFRYDRLYVKRSHFGLDVWLFVLSLVISLRGKWESRQRKV